MMGNDEDRGRSKRFGAEDYGSSSTCQILGDRMIERSDDVVYDLHRAQGDEEHMFLSLASKPRSTVSSDLASKPHYTTVHFYRLLLVTDRGLVKLSLTIDGGSVIIFSFNIAWS
jgi:hypothetical protein